MWHAWERREKCKMFWWKCPKKGDHLKDWGIDGRIILDWILGRLVKRVRSGFTWLRTGTDGGL
jgi:hypothetical protein